MFKIMLIPTLSHSLLSVNSSFIGLGFSYLRYSATMFHRLRLAQSHLPATHVRVANCNIFLTILSMPRIWRFPIIFSYENILSCKFRKKEIICCCYRSNIWLISQELKERTMVPTMKKLLEYSLLYKNLKTLQIQLLSPRCIVCFDVLSI